MSYADKLRGLADYLDSHPAIADRMSSRYDYPGCYIYGENWEQFQELIGALGGYEKSGSGGQLSAKHYEKIPGTDETQFYVTIAVSGVCEQVPKLDDEGNPVMREVTQYKSVPTGETEPEMEWKCPEVWSS